MFVRVGQSCLVFHHEVRCEAQSMTGCIISDQNFAQKLIAHSPLHSGAVNQNLPTGQDPPKIAHRRSIHPLKHRLADENVGVFPEPFHRWRDMVLKKKLACGSLKPDRLRRRMAPSVIRLCFLCSPRDWHLGELLPFSCRNTSQALSLSIIGSVWWLSRQLFILVV